MPGLRRLRKARRLIRSAQVRRKKLDLHSHRFSVAAQVQLYQAGTDTYLEVLGEHADLVHEEQKLREGSKAVDPARIRDIEHQLDQCWDLLRQRRAKREFGADPNAALPGGETPLMTAARVGSLASVKVLLARGATVDAKDERRGQTALMWAAAEGDSAMVSTLLELGADLRARSNGGTTAFQFAVRNGDMRTVQAMIAGADVNDKRPGDFATPLLVSDTRLHKHTSPAR